MDNQTKKQVLAKLRDRYRRAGKEHKSKILDDLQQLFGFHRKAAIRAVGSKPKPVPAAPALLGRPPLYASEKLLPVLKPIWFTAQQPCGRRLVALLPEWLPAFETDHRRLDSDWASQPAGGLRRHAGPVVGPGARERGVRGALRHPTGQSAAPGDPRSGRSVGRNAAGLAGGGHGGALRRLSG